MINRWNSIITSQDHIYHLGDFCFGGTKQTVSILEKLNGKKFLIKGNHDKAIKKEALNYFEWVKDYYLLTIQDKSVKHKKTQIILFHYPIESWAHQHYGSWHFCGHNHSKEPMPNKKLLRINVGVDAWGFEPISYELIKNYIGENYEK
jgi:calcineurin-like phosphoesterase family protein